MIREIKFRVWDELNKLYVYVSLEELLNNGGYNGNLLITDKWEQYTGLKDKNGVEIYEGDIFTSTDYIFQDNGKHNYHGEVFLNEEELCWSYQYHLANKSLRGISHGECVALSDNDTSKYVVIGNIQENKELLK